MIRQTLINLCLVPTGHFRCGPAPVTAIKEGLLCHPFDCGFVFAEVRFNVFTGQTARVQIFGGV